MVGKYGPYAYRVTKHHGKQTWEYLGRADRLANKKPIEGEQEPV
jgi:hypothetical protein